MVGKRIDIKQAKTGHADHDRKNSNKDPDQQAKNNGPTNQDDRSNNPVVDGIDH